MSDMAPQPARSAQQRKTDTLAKLRQRDADVWVATASDAGVAHLVPLSLAWDGDRVLLATERKSISCNNLEKTRRARLAIGPERDVVMIDAVVVSVIDATKVPHAIGNLYAEQADWDPREDPDGYVYVVLVPERIQAWREANEIAGRTLMRHGKWVV
jgi:hypothetical protein